MPTRIFKKFKAKNGQEIVLREPRIGDVKGLTDLYNSLINENITLKNPHTHRNKKNTISETEKYLVDVLEKIRQKKRIHLIAEADSKIIAAAGIQRGKDMENHLGEFAIMVHKDYRGIGIGKSISETLFSKAKELGVETAWLYVLVTNKTALELYKKLGFREWGRFPKSVKTKEKYIDDIYMLKEL